MTFSCLYYPGSIDILSHFEIPSSLHICGQILKNNFVVPFLYLKFMFFAIEFALELKAFEAIFE